MEQEKSKGYVFAVCQNADDPYICGALHVERDDQAVPWSCETDEEAARAAERDGVSCCMASPMWRTESTWTHRRTGSFSALTAGICSGR